MILGFVPVLILSPAYIGSGFPFGGEVLTNLLPIVEFRLAVASGDLPIYSDMLYQKGRLYWANPLSKVFYPFAWPLFIPGVPLAPTLKVILLVHVIAATTIAYVSAEKYLEWHVAAPFALLWILPLATHSVGHIEKILAYPWLVLLVWLLLPDNLDEHPKRTGLIVGVAAGMIWLAGANYFFIYAALFTASVALIYAGYTFAKWSMIGGLVGLPHLLVNVVPVLVGGTNRPAPGYMSAVFEVSNALMGLYLVDWIPGGASPHGHGYVIGIPAVILALAGIASLYRHAEGSDRRWFYAITAVATVSMGLATNAWWIYELPGTDIHRVGRRAILPLALCSLLFALFAIRQQAYRGVFDPCGIDTDRLYSLTIAVLLLVSAVMAGIGFFDMTHNERGPAMTVDIGDTDAMASSLASAGCTSAWIAATPAWNYSSDNGVPSGEVGYSLMNAGIGLRAIHYGAIDQEWQVRNPDGSLAFDVLITGIKLPLNGSIQLSESDRLHPAGDPVNVSRFGFLESYTIHTRNGERNLFAYAADRGCGDV